MRDEDVHDFVEQVQDAIALHQAYVDFGVGGEEVDKHRQHVDSPEHDRCGDHQLATRFGKLAGDSAFGFADIFEDALAGGEVVAARIGERVHHPRRPAAVELGAQQTAQDAERGRVLGVELKPRTLKPLREKHTAAI